MSGAGCSRASRVARSDNRSTRPGSVQRLAARSSVSSGARTSDSSAAPRSSPARIPVRAARTASSRANWTSSGRAASIGSKACCWRTTSRRSRATSSRPRSRSGRASAPTSATTSSRAFSRASSSMARRPRLGPWTADSVRHPGRQLVDVERVRLGPADRGEVPGVGQPGVERPERPGQAEARLGDRLREVAAGGRHGADEGDGSLALGRADGAHAIRPARRTPRGGWRGTRGSPPRRASPRAGR